MIWKILGITLIIIIIIYFIKKYGWCIYNKDTRYELLFHSNIDANWLNETIVVVYKLISPIAEELKVLLPVTNRLSHWMLGLELSNGVIITCSSSPSGYIEIYKVEHKTENIFVNTLKNWYSYICAKYTDIKSYTLKQFLDIYKRYYKSFHRYWFFDDNCQKMTSYALCNIFGIDDKETQREKYDLTIIEEYFKEMKNKCFGNGLQ